MRRRRQALVGGIVHRVKWKVTKLTVGLTCCGQAYFPGIGAWSNRRIRHGKATSKPVDCMACIAEGVP